MTTTLRIWKDSNVDSIVSRNPIVTANGNIVAYTPNDSIPVGFLPVSKSGALAFNLIDDLIYFSDGMQWIPINGGGGGGCAAISTITDSGTATTIACVGTLKMKTSSNTIGSFSGSGRDITFGLLNGTTFGDIVYWTGAAWKIGANTACSTITFNGNSGSGATTASCKINFTRGSTISNLFSFDGTGATVTLNLANGTLANDVMLWDSGATSWKIGALPASGCTSITFLGQTGTGATTSSCKMNITSGASIATSLFSFDTSGSVVTLNLQNGSINNQAILWDNGSSLWKIATLPTSGCTAITFNGQTGSGATTSACAMAITTGTGINSNLFSFDGTGSTVTLNLKSGSVTNDVILWTGSFWAIGQLPSSVGCTAITINTSSGAAISSACALNFATGTSIASAFSYSGTSNTVTLSLANGSAQQDLLYWNIGTSTWKIGQLATGTPVTISALTNSAGSAATYSKSDHIHAHGVQTDPSLHAIVTSIANGFMINTDKIKLDASTPFDSLSTLVQRSGSGTFESRGLNLYDSVGNQSVFLKAHTGSTAYNLLFPTTLGSNGQVLQTDGGTATAGSATTAWATVLTNPATTDLDMNGNDIINIGQIGPVANLTALRIVSTDVSQNLITATTGSSITFTTNIIDTIQPITTASSPTFVTLTLSGLTANRLVSTDGSSNLITSAGASTFVLGTANRITSTTNGTGGTIIDISAAYIGQTSITTLGTITTGTWNGTTIAVGFGGTGITSYTIGDLIYASGTTTLSKLADIATGNALISGGVATAPSWGKINLTTTVSGILPVLNGGTGQSTYTDGQLLIGNSTGNTLTKATLTAGSGITITNGSGSITIAVSGGGSVLSVEGTADQVLVNGTSGTPQSGALILTTPQNIGTTSTPTFSTVLLSSLTASSAVVSDASKNLVSITGNNGVLVTNGSGVPSISSTLPNAVQLNITQLGTITTGVWNGTTIAVLNGGTGQTTYTDGQLLIGNSTGNTLNKSTLTAGTGISITNGSGTITITNTISAAVSSVQGTANQVLVNGTTGSPQTGAIVLTTPQNIATTSDPSFNSVNTSGNTGTSNYGFKTTTTITASGIGIIYSGIISAPTLNISNTVNGYSVYSNPTFNISAATNISSAYGFFSGIGAVSLGAGATITTGYGGYFNTPVYGTTPIALYSDNLTIGSGINTTAAPTNGLLVQGNIQNNSLTASSAVVSDSSKNLVSITGNNGVLITSGAGVPSISSTLPSAVQLNITQLGTITTGVWNGSLIPLAFGGTNANLTANIGGIFYSTATAGAILAGTATANQVLLSGSSAAPSWSTATYPATTTINRILYSSAANTISEITTGNNGVLITSAGGIPSISSTLPSAVQLNITQLGTITTGIWNGTVIDPAYGGTGITSYTIGDLIYASGTTVLSKLADIATGNALISGGVATAPSWGKINLTTTVSGVLPLANGGTNANLTANNGGIFYSTSSAAAILSGTATANQVLLSGSTAAPIWSTATYPVTTTINQLLYSSATNTITGLATGNNGVLITGGTGIPSISSTLPNAVQLNITQLGTITTGVWTGTTIAVVNGGTGQTTYTDGQLLIGNTTGNTFTKATLTAGTGITITNGSGSITISQTTGGVTSITGTANQVLANGTSATPQTGSVTLTTPQDIGTSSTPTFSTVLLSSLTASSAVVSDASKNLVSITGNNGVLITSGVGVPSISSTLPNAVQLNITQLGTITTGVWNGTTIAVGFGGTGITSYTIGDLIYASGTTTLSKLADIATGNALLSGGVGVAPSWGKINLTTTVTGVLPLANGGTNANLTANNGGIFYSTASAGAILSGTATANQVLLSGSTAAPIWSTATYPVTTTANQLLYSSATNTISGLSTANNGVLITSGAGAPSISNTIPSATQLNITQLGTITTGVWNGTTIAVLNGGTGQTSYTDGQLLIGNSTGNTLTKAALTAGSGITITNGSGSITIAVSGAGTVTSITGTANQVLANGLTTPQTGAVTLTTPQNIDTAANVTFGSILASGTTPIFGFKTTNAISAAVGSTKYTGNYISPTFTFGSNTALAYGTYSNPSFTLPAATVIAAVYGFYSDIGAVSLGGGSSITTGYGGFFNIPTYGTTQIALYSANMSIGSGAATTAAPANGLIVAGNILNSALTASSAVVSDASKNLVSITGNNGVLVTNGSGVPSISTTIPSATQLNITQLGTITTGVWTGTTIAVANGGTGQTTYTNGQLLIGNTTGNTLTKATLTAGTGIAITNGTGSITLAVDGTANVTTVTGTANQVLVNGTSGSAQVGAITLTTPQNIGTTSSVQFNSITLNGSVGIAAINSTSTCPYGDNTFPSGCIKLEPIFGSANGSGVIGNSFGIRIKTTHSGNSAPNFCGIFVDWGSAAGGAITNSYGGYFTNPNIGSSSRIALYSDNLVIGTTNSTTTPPSNGIIVTGNILNSALTASSAVVSDASKNLVSITGNNGVLITSGVGVPSISSTIPSATQLNITQLGTITTGVWTGTTIAVLNGGTGQTTYTNGQLLIGNTTGNTLTKATLTAGTNVSITNGTGTITINATGAVSSVSGTTNQIGVTPTTGAAVVSLTNGISIGSYQAITVSGGIICPGSVGFGISSPATNADIRVSSTLPSGELGSLLISGVPTSGPGNPRLILGINYSAGSMAYGWISAIENGLSVRPLILQAAGGAAGGVGIGTTTPASGILLDINGSVRSKAPSNGSASCIFLSNSGAGTAYGITATDASAGLYFGRAAGLTGGAVNNDIFISSTGLIGMGLTPSIQLQVNQQLGVKDSTTDVRLGAINASSVGIVGTYSSDDLVFYTTGAERMRIKTSSGFVGVGANPSYPFEIAGSPTSAILCHLGGGLNYAGNSIHQAAFYADTVLLPSFAGSVNGSMLYANPNISPASGTTLNEFNGLRINGGSQTGSGTVLAGYGIQVGAINYGSTSRTGLYVTYPAAGATNLFTAYFDAGVRIGTTSYANQVVGFVVSIPNLANTYYHTLFEGTLIQTSTGTSGGDTTAFANFVNLIPTNGCAGAYAYRVQPSIAAPSGKTITSAYGIYINFNFNSNAGTINTMNGIRIDAGGSLPGGTLTDHYGLNVSAPVAGTHTYTAYFDRGVGIGVSNLSTATAYLAVASGIATAPPSSDTATTAYGTTVTLGTAKQNTLGYDIHVQIVIDITASATGNISFGVGSTSTPTTTTVFGTAFSGVRQVFLSCIVPNNYYLLVSSSGTVTQTNRIVAFPL